MVALLLAVGIRQSRESADAHSRREVNPLHSARPDVVRRNEARFDEKFTGKVITVTGNVRAIRKSTHRRYVVQLETALDVNIVVFVDENHRKELATYAPGDEVNVRGLCIGAVVPESDARRNAEIQILKAEPLETKQTKSELEAPPEPGL